ncbi:MAG: hypothetical protein A3J74_07385 [Elusimicrobia bacterium RIFCSPHIGHO2_02_FULL_57_9]|nr:MAG: hypothetical protein A3J74_07385 [Elusimicrobia bacterium RIFCSPHIGHO2_02_FULL_57_9]
MRCLGDFFSSSIGRKISVAAAGLLLCCFLITHLAGNLLLLAGEGTFNHYAEVLEANPLLPAAEIGLALIFLLHIMVSLKLKYENRRARPVPYVVQKGKGGRSWGSRAMLVSGLLLLAFLVIHVKTFRFTEHRESLYRHVFDAFQNKVYTLFYVAAMIGLGLHLSHGFQSALRTFGVGHSRAMSAIKRTGLILSAAIAAGFALLPLWFGFMAGGAR